MKLYHVLLSFMILLNYTYSFSRCISYKIINNHKHSINIMNDKYRNNRNNDLMMILDSTPITKYRNVQAKDLEQVARLVSNTFDGPYQIHQIFEKEKNYQTSLNQFKGRYEELVVKKVKNHAMIVATQNNTEALIDNNNEIVQGIRLSYNYIYMHIIIVYNNNIII